MLGDTARSSGSHRDRAPGHGSLPTNPDVPYRSGNSLPLHKRPCLCPQPQRREVATRPSPDRSMCDTDMRRGSRGNHNPPLLTNPALARLPSRGSGWEVRLQCLQQPGVYTGQDLYKPGSVWRLWQAEAPGNPPALTLVGPGAPQIIWRRQFNELEGLGSGSCSFKQTLAPGQVIWR